MDKEKRRAMKLVKLFLEKGKLKDLRLSLDQKQLWIILEDENGRNRED